MLWVTGIKVSNVQKQLQCLHGVLLCYLWVEFVKITDRSFEWAYCLNEF
jgi:ABC-type microcin C transport system permease subunit YejE